MMIPAPDLWETSLFIFESTRFGHHISYDYKKTDAIFGLHGVLKLVRSEFAEEKIGDFRLLIYPGEYSFKSEFGEWAIGVISYEHTEIQIYLPELTYHETVSAIQSAEYCRSRIHAWQRKADNFIVRAFDLHAVKPLNWKVE